MFRSYVKLDNQIWRIYQVNDTEVRLMLNDYLKVNNTELKYIYSNISSYHDDTKNGSIAYYLNKTFLNSLSYKSKIKEVSWTNGYYGAISNYDYWKKLPYFSSTPDFQANRGRLWSTNSSTNRGDEDYRSSVSFKMAITD